MQLDDVHVIESFTL